MPQLGHHFVTPGHVFAPWLGHFFVPLSEHLFVTPGHVFVPGWGIKRFPDGGTKPEHFSVPRSGHEKVTRSNSKNKYIIYLI